MESLRRRDFIRGMSFLGVAAGVKPVAASYNPAAKFAVKVSEVEYRRTKAGRQLIRKEAARSGIVLHRLVNPVAGGVAHVA